MLPRETKIDIGRALIAKHNIPILIGPSIHSSTNCVKLKVSTVLDEELDKLLKEEFLDKTSFALEINN